MWILNSEPLSAKFDGNKFAHQPQFSRNKFAHHPSVGGDTTTLLCSCHVLSNRIVIKIK